MNFTQDMLVYDLYPSSIKSRDTTELTSPMLRQAYVFIPETSESYTVVEAEPSKSLFYYGRALVGDGLGGYTELNAYTSVNFGPSVTEARKYATEDRNEQADKTPVDCGYDCDCDEDCKLDESGVERGVEDAIDVLSAVIGDLGQCLKHYDPDADVEFLPDAPAEYCNMFVTPGIDEGVATNLYDTLFEVRELLRTCNKQ